MQGFFLRIVRRCYGEGDVPKVISHQNSITFFTVWISEDAYPTVFSTCEQPEEHLKTSEPTNEIRLNVCTSAWSSASNVIQMSQARAEVFRTRFRCFCFYSGRERKRESGRIQFIQYKWKDRLFSIARTKNYGN